MARQIPQGIAHAAFDAIIIGAGINGAGIARDAAMRGLKVLLLDKGDLASGTTSWSTRLIHGGLRYLEHGEVSLVRESLRERERLLRIAPHLVRPLPLLIPVYERARRGMSLIRAGMILYDILSLDKSLEHHHMLSRRETLLRAPGLNTEGLRGAALYYDAQVEYAERLVLENALAAQAHGTTVLTYARVDRIIQDAGRVRGVEFTDLLDGSAHAARAPVTLNVAGPWVDLVRSLAASTFKNRMIGGTKGSHLIVSPFPGAPLDALYVEALEDRRPFFIIPWNKHYLIGTTDSRYEGDLDTVLADEKEIDYLIRETNRVIPDAALTRDSVLYTYSGIRPLAYREELDEEGITRRHFVHDHAPELDGLVSIVGGKLTTYRNLAEQAVDMLFKKLGRRSPACLTARVALPGATTDDWRAFSERFLAESPLPALASRRLLRIYGTRAREVLELAAEDTLLAEAFDTETGAIGAEILFSFRREMALTLADCLLRRTMVGMNSTVGLGADEAAAVIARKYLGWSESRAAQEVAAYRKYIERFHPHEFVRA
ncbi:MAG TPA: glycerol-3-phosphate dehydrogenase [Pyrinomonadaceae bacterium]|jgi:glycerol-3-phosphate dehydrogenase